jgi:hypothetical protein
MPLVDGEYTCRCSHRHLRGSTHVVRSKVTSFSTVPKGAHARRKVSRSTYTPACPVHTAANYKYSKDSSGDLSFAFVNYSRVQRTHKYVLRLHVVTVRRTVLSKLLHLHRLGFPAWVLHASILLHILVMSSNMYVCSSHNISPTSKGKEVKLYQGKSATHIGDLDRVEYLSGTPVGGSTVIFIFASILLLCLGFGCET